jgi:hypothetical protein
VAANADSVTGPYLARHLSRSSRHAGS